MKVKPIIKTVFVLSLTANIVSCSKDQVDETADLSLSEQEQLFAEQNLNQFVATENSVDTFDRSNKAAKKEVPNVPLVAIYNHDSYELLCHENFATGVTASRRYIGAWETMNFYKMPNGKYAIEARFPKDVLIGDLTIEQTGGFLHLLEGSFSPVYFGAPTPNNSNAQFEMVVIGETDKSSDLIDVVFKCDNGKYLTIRKDPNAPDGNLPKECTCSGDDDLKTIWSGDKKSIFRVQRVDRKVGFE